MTVYTIDTDDNVLLINGRDASEFTYQALLDFQRVVGEIVLDAASNHAYLDLERRMGRAAFYAVFDPTAYPKEHKRIIGVCEEINRETKARAD